jgi:hypothetical protein
MLKNGTYAAWFKTPLGQGTGIARVEDGKIWGRDSITAYSGSCEADGDRFTAILSVERHTEGHATVFGVDNFRISLVGTCVGKIASYVGTSEEAPDVLLEGTLILSEQQPSGPSSSARAPVFNPDRLPKPPKTHR